MRILFTLTYYRPHVSGLTMYVERLAAALVARGHDVTILTSRHDASLPHEDVVDGVRVVRAPVAFNVSKGPVMPSLPLLARRLIDEHDIVSGHLPMFEAAMFAALGRTMRTPTILTYHCDLLLPPGMLNRAVEGTVFASNWLAARLVKGIVAYTNDYAAHSRLLRQFMRKITVISPPVVMPAPSPDDVARFREQHRLEGRTVIGFASRFAAEKGIEHLVDALPPLLERFPNLNVLFAGPNREVIGEEAYRERLRPKIEALGERWKFLGTLGPGELPAFYASLDALLMTSVNSTESFGLVQVEAMLCGTPVVATNLPGVRQPVTVTGMGEIVAIADPGSLTEGIAKVLSMPERYRRTREVIERLFDIEVTVSAYERLFEEAIANVNRS